MARSQEHLKIEIFSGWKDIASYLRKGVRTVQRYERELGLPVRRPAGKSSGSVIATKAELDGWVDVSPLREVFRLPKSTVDNHVEMKKLHDLMEQSHRLHEESVQLRAEMKQLFELFRANIEALFAEQLSSPQGRLLADVLSFDTKRKKAN